MGCVLLTGIADFIDPDALVHSSAGTRTGLLLAADGVGSRAGVGRDQLLRGMS
ncbi:hypothetical protein [Blastococcus capsensis]|uniref:hypothetical protein n=1 Tax=Blastococcus capsensis TaxID=1564163 RepID=UPI00253F7A91|nr:hypothetical protein [Blastococcus capsensis]MDK3255740.1 hypothetical protein [Blastococcus capsensis]